jgi:hypothetical protein
MLVIVIWHWRADQRSPRLCDIRNDHANDPTSASHRDAGSVKIARPRHSSEAEETEREELDWPETTVGFGGYQSLNTPARWNASWQAIISTFELPLTYPIP